MGSGGLWLGGILLSVLLPIVGLIAGIYYVVRGGRRARCGWMCIGLSVLMFVVYLAAFERSGDAEPAPYGATPAQALRSSDS